MASAKRTRAVAPGVYGGDAARHLAELYCDCYGNDPRFRRGLATFAAEHRGGIAALPRDFWYFIERDPEHTTWAVAVRAFAAAWRLDLWAWGSETLVRWCCLNRDYPDECTPAHFRHGLSFLGANLVTFSTEPLAIHIELPVDLSRATRTAVREYALAQCGARIDAELNRIQRDFEGAGFVFASGQTRDSVQHVNWLYRHIVNGETFASIAASESGMSDDVVRKRIAHYRRALAISKVAASAARRAAL